MTDTTRNREPRFGRRVRRPPYWMNENQRRAFQAQRELEWFLKDLLADEPGMTTILWFWYCNFGKQVYSVLHKVADKAEQSRLIDRRVAVWADRTLDPRLLSRITDEIRKAIAQGKLR